MKNSLKALKLLIKISLFTYFNLQTKGLFMEVLNVMQK